MAQPKTIGALEINQVLEDMGFNRSAWDRLNWFVELAGKNLDALTEGARMLLQEQMAAIGSLTAIHGVPVFPRNDHPIPDWEVVKDLHQQIQRYIGEWLKEGFVVMEPFHLTISIFHVDSPVLIDSQRGKPFIDSSIKSGIPGQEKGRHFARYSLGSYDAVKEGVLFTFGELLREHASAIVRCQHCERIFLKLRKHARFCSRQCHSVAGMRLKRQRDKEQLAAVSVRRQTTKGRKAKRKEKIHGKSRR